MNLSTRPAFDRKSFPVIRATGRLLWAAWLGASVVLILLPMLFKLDGKAHSDWQQMLGRFHPIIVHFPIGLILLVPLLEFGGRYRAALREASAFVLSLSALACLAAVIFGYLLAYGSGTAGVVVTRHMWGGIFLTILVAGCAVVRSGAPEARTPGFYPWLLASVLVLMIWSTHQGGSLTHGSNYLTEYLPPSLKHVSLFEAARATPLSAPNSFYTRHLHPIFDANCVTCHGEGKIKGGLRLDSYDRLMRGGKEGAAVVPGHPERSILFERITLPSDHKKFMPSEGKPPLKAEQIAWIKAWIAQGASPTVNALPGIDVKDEPQELPLAQVGDYSGLATQIAALEEKENIKLTPVSRKAGDGLILRTVDAGESFNDAGLTQLAGLAPYIVEAELGRTAVSDSCIEVLVKFTHLRALHLEDTALTGAGLSKLNQLSELTYLNLSGTQVTEAAVEPLRLMKNLQHLYLYNTPAQPVSKQAADAAASLKPSP